MFSCLSFTRRNTKESRQGSGTAITVDHRELVCRPVGTSEQMPAPDSTCYWKKLKQITSDKRNIKRRSHKDNNSETSPALSISTACRLGGMRFSAMAFR